MRITTIIVVLLFTALFWACSNQTIESKKTTTQVIIDGIGNDWNKNDLTFNEDFDIVFGSLYTDSTLYMMFRFNNRQLARIFATRGLTLWLDKNKQTGIRYRDENLHFLSEREQRDPNRINETYFPMGHFKLVSKEGVIEESLKTLASFDAAFALNNSLYCFEFEVPLNTKSPFSIATQNKEITIGVELAKRVKNEHKPMNMEHSDGESSENHGGVSGRRGQRGNRGEYSGRGGLGGAIRRPTGNHKNYEGKNIWFDIKLTR
jgi:hypothetical protein